VPLHPLDLAPGYRGEAALHDGVMGGRWAERLRRAAAGFSSSPEIPAQVTFIKS
jgi:hypothetical protein